MVRGSGGRCRRAVQEAVGCLGCSALGSHLIDYHLSLGGSGVPSLTPFSIDTKSTTTRNKLSVEAKRREAPEGLDSTTLAGIGASGRLRSHPCRRAAIDGSRGFQPTIRRAAPPNGGLT